MSNDTYSLQKVCEEYIDHVVSKKVAYTTLKRRRNTVKKLTAFLNEKSISHFDHITCQIVEDFEKRLKELGTAESMMTVHKAGVNDFLTYLKERELINDNPLEISKYPFLSKKFPADLKRYYDDYLDSIKEQTAVYKASKPILRELLTQLWTDEKRIERIEEITIEEIKLYLTGIKKKQTACQAKHYLKCWLSWLNENGVSDLINDPFFAITLTALSPFMEEYLGFMEKRGLGENSIKSEKWRLGHIFKYLRMRGKDDLNEVDLNEARNFLSYLDFKGLKVSGYLNTFKRLYYYGLKKGLVENENPFEVFLKGVRKKREGKKVKRERVGRTERVKEVPDKYVELLNDYLSYLKTRDYRRRTIIRYKYCCLYFFEYMDEKGIAHLHSTGLKEAEEYQGWILSRGREKKKEYLQGSAKGRIEGIRSFFKYLKKRGIISTNPFYEVDPLKREKILPRNIPDEKGVDHLLKSLRDFNDGETLTQKLTLYQAHVIGELMYASGLRIHEVAQLKEEDIDFEGRMIHVHSGKGGVDRKAFLNEYSCEILKLYVKEMMHILRSTSIKKSKTLFGLTVSSMVGRINRSLKNQCRSLNMSDLTSHYYRHSLATHLLRRGCDIRYIQAILGHEALSSTEIYTRVDKEDLKKVFKKYHPRQLRKRREDV